MAFNPAQSFSQGFQGGRNILAAQTQNEIDALQQSIATQSGAGGFDPSNSLEFQQLAALDPNAGARILSTFNSLSDSRKSAAFQDARKGIKLLESGNAEGFVGLVTSRIENTDRLKGDSSGSRGVLDAYNSGDIQGALDQLRATEQIGIDMGFLSDPLEREERKARISGSSAKMREIESLIAMAEADPKGETIKGKAALTQLGLIAKVSTSASERIAESESLKSSIVQLEADKTSAREAAKGKQQLIYKPQINEAVRLAEKAATERGEVLNRLDRSKAALPGLNAAVDELRELAIIATSTFGGKLFDQAVKQSGFGATKGANARAKFIAIINNQVLPLLKPTFGGSFTVAEGDALKATMGDPDSSPEEKLVQLDAFIAQKLRDIETDQRQLGQQSAATPTGNIDPSKSTDDELRARLGL